VDIGLPEGWTIDQVRRVSGDVEATGLSLDRHVALEEHGTEDRTLLQPEIIISFHELCLVSADGEWFMGNLAADGSVACLATYGSDLGQAIRGL
jgi:hypothetical protein